MPTQKKPIEKRIARAGPPLPEALRLLVPLAPTLEKLHLSGNKLGGTISEDITVFTKLTELELYQMGLNGVFCVESVPTQKKPITEHSRAFPVMHRRHPGVDQQSHEPDGPPAQLQQVDRCVC